MDKKIVIDRSTADSINNIYNTRWALHDKQVSSKTQEANKLDGKADRDHHNHVHKRKASDSAASDDSESSESSLNLFEDEDEHLTKAELYSMKKLNKVIIKATSATGMPSHRLLPNDKQDSNIQDKMVYGQSSTRDPACNDSLLALATQIGASSISGRTSMNRQCQRRHQNNDDLILPSPRKYQRRNSFVIRRNRSQKYVFPPSLFLNQDIMKNKSSGAATATSGSGNVKNEESFHQSSPELFLNPSAFVTSSQDHQERVLPTSTSKASGNSGPASVMEEWGNASWSNTHDTEWYQSSLLASQVGLEPIIPVPSQSSSSSSFESEQDTNVFKSASFSCPSPLKSTGSQTTEMDKDDVTIVSSDSS